MTSDIKGHVCQASDSGPSEIRNNVDVIDCPLIRKRVQGNGNNLSGHGGLVCQPTDAGQAETSVTCEIVVHKPFVAGSTLRKSKDRQLKTFSPDKPPESDDISTTLFSDRSRNNTTRSSAFNKVSIAVHKSNLYIGKKIVLEVPKIIGNAVSACLGISTYLGMFVVPYCIIAVIVCAFPVTALEPADGRALEPCKPKLFLTHNSIFEVGGPIDLACKVDTCVNSAMVVFAKTGDNLSSTWRSVYKGINNTNHHALPTGTSYSLEGRDTEYAAFTTHHILLIQQLLLEDHGHWKCIVHDTNGAIYDSNMLEFTVYASPREGDLTINPNYTVLVTNQTVLFVCEISDVYPEPNVIWIVNETTYRQGKPKNHQNINGLWMVNNVLEFCTVDIGEVNLSCQIKASGRMTKPKEAANIIYPVKEIVIETTFDTLFTLKCSGSGYRPYITWEKDDHPIDKDDFSITTSCSEDSHTCYSLLSPNPARKDVPCVYTGTYFCIVKLDTPYHTTPGARSAKMKLYILGPKENNHTLMIVFCATVSAVLVIVVVYSLYYKTGGIKCLRLHSGNGNGTTSQSESFLLSTTGLQEDRGEV